MDVIYIFYGLEFLIKVILFTHINLHIYIKNLLFYCFSSCVGYEELTAGPAGVDYSKGYNSSSQAQAKSAASGPGKGTKKKHTFPF